MVMSHLPLSFLGLQSNFHLRLCTLLIYCREHYFQQSWVIRGVTAWHQDLSVHFLFPGGVINGCSWSWGSAWSVFQAYNIFENISDENKAVQQQNLDSYLNAAHE